MATKKKPTPKEDHHEEPVSSPTETESAGDELYRANGQLNVSAACRLAVKQLSLDSGKPAEDVPIDDVREYVQTKWGVLPNAQQAYGAKRQVAEGITPGRQGGGGRPRSRATPEGMIALDDLAAVTTLAAHFGGLQKVLDFAQEEHLSELLSVAGRLGGLDKLVKVAETLMTLRGE